MTCGRVTEQLYVGGELGPHDCFALVEAGVTVIVNLQQEQQDIFSPKERGLLHGYLWLPAPDGLAPSVEQLILGVSFVRAAMDEGQRVFVHCKAGQGRAPLLCACYLISEGATPVNATAQVRKARPQTMLTPDQAMRLREFAAVLGVKMGAADLAALGPPNGSAREAPRPVPEHSVSRSRA